MARERREEAKLKHAEVRWRFDKAQADAVGGDAAKNPAKVAAADAAAIAARANSFDDFVIR